MKIPLPQDNGRDGASLTWNPSLGQDGRYRKRDLLVPQQGLGFPFLVWPRDPGALPSNARVRGFLHFIRCRLGSSRGLPSPSQRDQPKTSCLGFTATKSETQ